MNVVDDETGDFRRELHAAARARMPFKLYGVEYEPVVKPDPQAFFGAGQMMGGPLIRADRLEVRAYARNMVVGAFDLRGAVQLAEAPEVHFGRGRDDLLGARMHWTSLTRLDLSLLGETLHWRNDL